MFELPPGLVDAVLDRLGVGAAAADRDALARVYGAWCQAVPFDNVLKRLALAERWPGRLPGSTAVDFFRDWIEYRTGGTCWAGNGALFALPARSASASSSARRP
jgi:N-hydroxyarylamine O-acetyltransferase